MILIAGTLTFPPGGVEKAREAMQKVVEATRREDGCVSYDFAVGLTEPDQLIVLERWRDQKALEGHFRSLHMTEWREAAQAAGPPQRDLRVWEVGEGRAL